jgi:hypothetical protein
VLDRYGTQLQVDGTLLKPITQQTLAAALEPYSAPPEDDSPRV